MDHSEATKLGAAEKYLLGELSSDQRDQFEEHFFTCPECAADVRSGAVFVDNARPILQAEPAMQTMLKPLPGRRWLDWLKPAYGLAAVVALVGVISYQNLVTIPRLEHAPVQPETLTSISLVNSAASRGGGTAVVHALEGRPFGIYVDIPATQPFPYYTLDVRTGDRHFAVLVSGEQAKDTVQILVPAGTLPSGQAELVINGRASQDGPVTEVARYPFQIQLQ